MLQFQDYNAFCIWQSQPHPASDAGIRPKDSPCIFGALPFLRFLVEHTTLFPSPTLYISIIISNIGPTFQAFVLAPQYVYSNHRCCKTTFGALATSILQQPWFSQHGVLRVNIWRGGGAHAHRTSERYRRPNFSSQAVVSARSASIQHLEDEGV